MWEYVLGGATVFGAIMALPVFYNGGVTRNLIVIEQKAVREHLEKLERLIVEEQRAAREVLSRLSD